MKQPQQGEIWRIKLGRRKRGTEIRGHDPNDPEGERPCLIVSADTYNEFRRGLTIVPLTSHTDEREQARALWAVTITNREDIDIDPSNRSYRPIREQLLTLELGRPKKSIIDCGQLWTVNKLSRFDQENDLRWDRRYGELSEEKLIHVESALQVILGDSVRYTRQNEEALPCQQGDVLELEMPIHGSAGMNSRLCLIVSSTGVDAIREQIHRHCTVVPLESIDRFKEGDRSVALVDVYPADNRGKPEQKLALCQEIYTVDWRSRVVDGIERAVGHVRSHHMDRVWIALREYLALPR
jgi:mRNA-degrading endonuclease toxin of MazEF toxin-antitoxin module